MSEEINTMAYEAELLAVSPGTMGGRPKSVLTFRMTPEASFTSINIAISREQALRLRDDLQYIFENYSVMKGVETDLATQKTAPPKPKPDVRGPKGRRRKRRGK